MSLIALVGCSLAIGATKHIENVAETKLPTDYVTLSDSNATFVYQTLPEAYQNIYVRENPSVKTNVKGAMVFTAINNDSGTGIDYSMSFATTISNLMLSRDFYFFEYLVVTDTLSNTAAVKDMPPFASISMTLAEKNNPANFITISNHGSPYHNHASIIRGSAANMSPAGKDKNDSFYDSSKQLTGSGVEGSLSGAYLNKDTQEVKDIYAVSYAFDNATNIAYAYPSTIAGTKKDILVRDFDNPEHMLGFDEVFQGFQSEELIATLTINDLKGGKAQIAVLGLNGAKLYGDSAEEIVDNNAPIVYPVNYIEGVEAEVGVAFPVFHFNSYDDIDGLKGLDEYKVYYDYGKSTQKEIQTEKDIFVPEKAGEYMIVAKKTDSSGNIGEARYKVEARKKLPPFVLSLQGSIPTYTKVGYRITLPDALVAGGTVGVTYSLSVWHNGEEVFLDKFNNLYLEKQGLYTIRYSVFDYRNVPLDFEYYIQAQLSEVPVVEWPNMPKYISVGATLKTPNFHAVDWYSYPGIASDAIVSATIQKTGGEVQNVGNGYTFKEVGDYTYTLTAKSIIGEFATSETYTIKAIETEMVTDYFAKNKVETIGEEEVIFVPQEDGASFEFINALPVNTFALKFCIPETHMGFKKLTLNFMDKYAKNEVVTVDCTPNGKKGFMEVCGQKMDVDSAFGGRDYSISFKENSLYNLNRMVAPILHYDNGDEFTGFTSGYIYVRFQFNDVSKDAGVSIKTLGNHSYFEAEATDISAPMVRFEREVQSVLRIGEIVKIPNITAYDVFEGEKEVYIRVLKDGKEIPLLDDNTFMVTEFGVYVLRIETSDTTGHRTTMNKNMYCHNQTGPTILVKDKVVTTGKLNKPIKIAPATAMDYLGNEVTVRTFVLKKGGEYVMVDENNQFTPNESTEYVIWYTATDADFNTTIIKFVVKV